MKVKWGFGQENYIQVNSSLCLSLLLLLSKIKMLQYWKQRKSLTPLKQTQHTDYWYFKDDSFKYNQQL